MAIAEASKGKNTRRELDPAAAEAIAIALGEVLDMAFMRDWVQIADEPAAGVYSVLVVVEDVMARIYPYVDTLAWASIRDDVLVGYGMDGLAYPLPIKAHGQAVGMSTFGKSGLIHVLLAHITRCADAVAWVCGRQKLYDLVADWLEPYTDTDQPLPLDWVANGQDDTLQMLAAAMRIARWRQAQPMRHRGGWPTIMVILDEASFVLEDASRTIEFEGQQCTASNLAAQITRGAASADVHLILATQRSTNDNFGEYGGVITANLVWSAAFRSKDDDEVGRLTGNWKLPMPRHRGAYWLDPGNGDLPLQLKGPYLQTTDPTKPVLHNGATITEVARSRARFHTGMDAGSAAIAGEAYQRRHTRMDDAMLAYLTGTTVHAAVSTAHQAGFDQVMRDLQRLGLPAAATEPAPAAELGVPASTTPTTATAPAVPPVTAAPAVAALGEKRSRPQRILDILRDADRPLERADILAALHAGGDQASDQVVTNALKKLIDGGEAHRQDDGYVIAS